MRRELREIAQWFLTEMNDLFLSVIITVMLQCKDEGHGFLPVLTWYLRVSLQSTSSWSRLSGSSGMAKSITSLSWSGLWKSRILVVLSFWTVMWSRRISITALRNSLVLASVSSALPVWQTGHSSEQEMIDFWLRQELKKC